MAGVDKQRLNELINKSKREIAAVEKLIQEDQDKGYIDLTRRYYSETEVDDLKKKGIFDRMNLISMKHSNQKKLRFLRMVLEDREQLMKEIGG